MDSEVMNILSGGSKYIFNNEKDLRKEHPSNYTATISGISKVYNIIPGTVIFFGFFNNLGTLYVSISDYEVIRYMNLGSVTVRRSDELEKGAFLGEVAKNKSLLVEYCTEYQQGSPYPVRFNEWTYYKQNPIDILDGVYWPYQKGEVMNGVVRPNNTVEFTDQQKMEWFSSEYISPEWIGSPNDVDYWR